MGKRWLQVAAKGFGFLLAAALAAFSYSTPMRQIAALPDIVRLAPGEKADLPAMDLWLLGGQDTVPVRQSADESLERTGSGTVSYRLFGRLPVRSIEVIESDLVYLVPGGDAVGITIKTQGVLVVGLGTVETPSGPVSPAAAAGLEAGDWILSVDDSAVTTGAELADRIAPGEARTLTVCRDGVEIQVLIHPAQSAEGPHRLGAWVRDSTAGVGTLSFLDTSSGWFAALGHPVSDIDTQETLLVREGRLVPAEIVDVVRGSQGTPGELMGVFSSAGISLGNINANTEYGIYGGVNPSGKDRTEQQIPMGYAFEAHAGEATLLSTISDRGVESFSCQIVRVSTQDAPSTKGMVIQITDERLLGTTGGIVQGMSGSPVLQDGKLVGVVTHVFVNDPTRGYCVYAEWMHEEMMQARTDLKD